jgi:resolvase-like protein
VSRAGSSAKPIIRKRRCAVYTRKSSEEGLDMEFNSLDAQRDACEAYVASQRSEGWVLVPDRYDDGGISGATLERPALQRLMRDVETGLIDVVVVYQIRNRFVQLRIATFAFSFAMCFSGVTHDLFDLHLTQDFQIGQAQQKRFTDGQRGGSTNFKVNEHDTGSFANSRSMQGIDVALCPCAIESVSYRTCKCPALIQINTGGALQR